MSPFWSDPLAKHQNFSSHFRGLCSSFCQSTACQVTEYPYGRCHQWRLKRDEAFIAFHHFINFLVIATFARRVDQTRMHDEPLQQCLVPVQSRRPISSWLLPAWICLDLVTSRSKKGFEIDDETGRAPWSRDILSLAVPYWHHALPFPW